MVRFFISYARADGSELANMLTECLEHVHHSVFLDVQNIVGSTRWRPELEKEVRHCDVLLLLVTPGSIDSSPVFSEFETAQKYDKKILPVQVNGTSLPPHLREIQSITHEAGKDEKLVLDILRSIQSHSGRIGWWQIVAAAIIGLAIGLLVGALLLSRPADDPGLVFPRNEIGYIGDPGSGDTVARTQQINGGYNPEFLDDQTLFVFVIPRGDRFYVQLNDGCDQLTATSVELIEEEGRWLQEVVVGVEEDTPDSLYQIVLTRAESDAAATIFSDFLTWCERESFDGYTLARINDLQLEVLDTVIVTR